MRKGKNRRERERGGAGSDMGEGEETWTPKGCDGNLSAGASGPALQRRPENLRRSTPCRSTKTDLVDAPGHT